MIISANNEENAMARIGLVSPETATEDVKEIYDKILRENPQTLRRLWRTGLRCLRAS